MKVLFEGLFSDSTYSWHNTVLKEIISKNIDVLLLSETKLDESFPINQFQIDGYKTIRKDRNQLGGGICLYINENIASKELTLVSLFEIEYICVALNLGKHKWLIVGLYKPPNTNETFFTNKLSAALNELSKTYDNLLLLGDFNMTHHNSKLQEVLVNFNLKKSN